MRRLALAVTVLLLAACSSGSKHGSSATTGAAAAKDKVLATSLVLQASDYPSGWTTAPASSDNTESAAEKKLNVCTGATGATEDSATADGPDATKGNAQVSSSASVKKTRAAFEQDAAALTLAKLQACSGPLKEMLQSSAGQDAGTSIGDVSMAPLSVPSYGELTKGFRLTVQVTANGDTVPVYLDVIALGKGRAAVSLTFTNVGAPFDAATEQALVAKVGAKLK